MALNVGAFNGNSTLINLAQTDRGSGASLQMHRVMSQTLTSNNTSGEACVTALLQLYKQYTALYGAAFHFYQIKAFTWKKRFFISAVLSCLKTGYRKHLRDKSTI